MKNYVFYHFNLSYESKCILLNFWVWLLFLLIFVVYRDPFTYKILIALIWNKWVTYTGDFSMKKSYIFFKNNTGESNFALTWSIYSVLSISKLFFCIFIPKSPLYQTFEIQEIVKNLDFSKYDRNVIFSLKYSSNKSKIGM